MRIAIISFAHGHAYSYANALKERKDVTLVGIADDDHERGRSAAAQYNTDFYQDIDTLLEQNLDAVIITSENSKHHEHVLAAAKAGVNILCEKPIATTPAAAKEMIKVCEENGVLLQIAFPVRFSTPIARAKKVIESGELGNIIAVKGTNRGTNPGGWFVDVEQSGGGAVMDHTVHVVDVLRWYLGAEVKEVYAEIGTQLSEGDIDDSGILTMEFDNNVFATLDCSWSRNETFPTWGDVTLEIVGSKGTLSVDAFAQQIDVYSKDGVSWDSWGDNMDRMLVEDFVTNVKNGNPPSITGEDGLRALEVAYGGYESFKRKQPVSI